MIIGTCTVTLEAPWVESLKEKRMIVKSIEDKLRHTFNISVAEVDCQDMHKTIVLGFACVTNDSRHANSIIDNVLDFIERSAEAEITGTVIEIL